MVSGATGGVGIIAVQLLEARGAHVVATASTGDEIAFVREHGADDVVDYRGDVAATRETHLGSVDAVLHFAGEGATLAALLSSGGRMASTLGLTSEQLERDDLTLAPIMASPVTGTLAKPADAAAAGTIRVPIMRTYGGGRRRRCGRVGWRSRCLESVQHLQRGGMRLLAESSGGVNGARGAREVAAARVDCIAPAAESLSDSFARYPRQVQLEQQVIFCRRPASCHLVSSC